jgi:hypothetical protein
MILTLQGVVVFYTKLMCEWHVKGSGQSKKNVGTFCFCYKMGRDVIQLKLVLVVNIIE